MTPSPTPRPAPSNGSDGRYCRFMAVAIAKQRAREAERRVDRLPSLRSSKPSPASGASSRRAESMAVKASIRRDEIFIAKKAAQRRARKEAR